MSALKHGIHANTLRLWKAKFGGIDTAEFARLKADGRRKQPNAADHRYRLAGILYRRTVVVANAMW